MRAWSLLLALAPVVIGPASNAVAQTAADSEVRVQLERYMGYFVRDGGGWRADNPAYEVGGSAAMQYGYEYRWDFHDTVVRNTIYGIFEGGERRDFAESIFAWNPEVGKVEQFLFGIGGGIGRGFEEHLDGDVIEDVFSWESLGGQRTEMKDWVKITGPDSFDNATFVKDANGAWQLQPNSELVFRRIRP